MILWSKHEDLNFLLQCNYDVKYLKDIPTFYRDILIAFYEIKTLYNWDQGTDTIIFKVPEVKNNCCLFERLFKLKKNGVFLFGISFRHFNNKEILVDGKPLFIRKCFIMGFYPIQKLFNQNGQYLTFQEFQAKYHCNKLSPPLSNPCAFEEQSAGARAKSDLQLQRKREIIFIERK